MSISPIILAIASLFAAVFGFSIVRGGVCTLAAVEELVLEGRWKRLQGFAELWLWIGTFFLIAHVGFGIEFTKFSYEATISTIVGGFFLAFGAYVNQACPFGTIAAIGSGYWSYLATPIGLFAGSVIHVRHLSFLSPQASPLDSPLLTLSPLLLAPILVWLAWRCTRGISRHARSGDIHVFVRNAWSPLFASVVVAVSFCALAFLVGPWSYTQLLADLASERYEAIHERLVLLMAMFGGAIAGGLTDKGWSPKPATPKGLLYRFVGGFIMGIGHKLVPGAHDSLTLVGQPLMLSYAWVSMAIIYLTLGVVYMIIRVRRRVRH